MGPSSNTEEKISALIEAGIDGFRLNFSHGTQEEHKRTYEIVRRVAKEKGVRVTVVAEMAEPLHVIPATYKAEEMDELLKLPGTKVLMKSGKRLKKVRDSILRSGQNAVMIENCGMPEEKIYASAKEIPEEAGYYTLLVVKDKK